MSGGLATGSFPGNAGGGVFNNVGAMILTNSTVSGNSAAGGGGVYNFAFSTATLARTLVSGNTAASGRKLEILMAPSPPTTSTSSAIAL